MAVRRRRRGRPTTCPFWCQRHLQPAGAVAAFVDAKDLHQRRFPGRRFTAPPHRPLLARLPGVIPTGRHAQHLAEPPHRVVAAPGGEEAGAAQWPGACERLRSQQVTGNDIFLKSPTPAPAAGPGPAAGAVRRPWPGPGRHPRRRPPAFGPLFAAGKCVWGRCGAPGRRRGSNGFTRPGARLRRGRPHRTGGDCRVSGCLS